eukprot:SAG31_NODE_4014_length_3664_cov_2.541094_1_plen_904_part_00
MSDGKYFGKDVPRRGEMQELREELNNVSKDKVKIAVKKTIAAMTIGKDVATLFMEMLKCMQTTDVELKKLVYLYLINYAKQKPDLAIMAVNSFVSDAKDPNPLVRALALRTMSSIRVDKITEYLCDPLRAALLDTDPYVKKTAAFCVVKLHLMNPELVREQDYLGPLTDLLSDSNPMVVSNAVAALTEMSRKTPQFVLDSDTVDKLLLVLNEATPWGQVYILDALTTVVPSEARKAEEYIDRVGPRLSHHNSSVVLSAARFVVTMLGRVDRKGTRMRYAQKLVPPLVSLALQNGKPEVQYVALRNISLIVRKLPEILSSEYKVFFCKFNDPLYVKLEKLELMVQMADDRNTDAMLSELKEYAQEVDVDFVRKSVRSIGLIAIKLEKAAERCVKVLLELIQSTSNYGRQKSNHVVQESIVVIKDIFRKYPNRYEAVIATLCEALDTLDEPEAKGALVWIIGEYSDRIENADELLETFIENFHEEPVNVQLQLLTAVAKLFLFKPAMQSAQKMLQNVIQFSTQESDNPDLRDRGFIYWRLLSTDQAAAKLVVTSEKPVISADSGVMEASMVDRLIAYVGTLASVFHKLPATFISESEYVPLDSGVMGGGAEEQSNMPSDVTEDEPMPEDEATSFTSGSMPTETADLLGLEPALMTDRKPIVLTAQDGGGLEITAAFGRSGGGVILDVTVSNKCPLGSPPISNCHIQFNKNAFAMKPERTAVPMPPVPPGQSQSCELRVAIVSDFVPAPGTMVEPNVQCAVKSSLGAVVYFRIPVLLSILCEEDGRLGKSLYLEMWRGIPDENEVSRRVDGLCDRCQNTNNVSDLLDRCNIFSTARRYDVKGTTELEFLYTSLRTVNDVIVLMELVFPRGGGNVCKVSIRTGETPIVPVVMDFVERLLKDASFLGS